LNRLLPLEIEALIRLRDLDGARELLDPFLGRAAQTGPGWAAAASGRCHGLLLAASNDLVAAEHVLVDAVEASAGLGMPFEHARNLLISGEVNRRARHRRLAKESLTEAKAIFDRLGARIWSARCSDELVRTAGRTRSDGVPRTDALTATEKRVADLAAQGYTTREIAGTLFTGIRTVEAHLHRVYQKLGVRSRIELSLRLAGERPAADA
jgi:DNA-binding CsgD family transcriptional regulator